MTDIGPMGLARLAPEASWSFCLRGEGSSAKGNSRSCSVWPYSSCCATDIRSAAKPRSIWDEHTGLHLALHLNSFPGYTTLYFFWPDSTHPKLHE